MANAQNSNSFYIDSTGSLTTKANTRVSAIIFTPDSANDQLILKDTDNSGSIKISLRGATGKQSFQIDFFTPIVFPGGMYVSTLTSNATATIITTGTT